jgi:hypothetical protein
MILSLFLVLAAACPAQCGAKWSYSHDNPHGDFSWQVCVAVNGGDPQTCIPQATKGHLKWK